MSDIVSHIDVPYVDEFANRCLATVFYPRDLLENLGYLAPDEIDDRKLVIDSVEKAIPTMASSSTGIVNSWTKETYTNEYVWRNDSPFILLKAKALIILNHFRG